MEFRYIKNGSSLTIDEKACIGCGMCREVCPHGVFVFEEMSARSNVASAATNAKPSIRDRALCMECGACAKNCPALAITVKSGVGCTAAIIGGLLRGGEPSCDCECGEENSSMNSGKSGKKRTCC